MRTALMEMTNNQLDEAKTVLSNFMNDRKKEQIIHLAKQKGLKVKDMGDKIEVSGPKGKVADMTVIHKPVRERAAWVPESIADEQVEAFMEATVAAVAEGEDTFVFEGKHYKAKSKKEDKLDPVGQEDDDVDNDGDVDSSDKYLKKRRSAIKKSMDEEQVDEKYTDKQDASYTDRYSTGGKDTADMQKRRKAAIKKAADRFKKTGSYTGKKESVEEAVSDTYMTVDYDYSDNFGMLELFKNGKKIGSWDGYPSQESGKNYLAIEATKLAKKHGVNPSGLKTVDAENPKRVGKLVPNKDFGFPRGKAKRESVEEAAGTAQHGPDNATSDTFQKQMGGGRTPKEKEFVDMHKMEVGLDVNKIHDDNKANIEAALKQTPPRLGDKSDGDKNVVNPIPTNMVDGMRAALAKMKNSGE